MARSAADILRAFEVDDAAPEASAPAPEQSKGRTAAEILRRFELQDNARPAAPPAERPPAAPPPPDPFISGGGGTEGGIFSSGSRKAPPGDNTARGMGGALTDPPPRAPFPRPDTAPVVTGSGQMVRPLPYESGIRSYLQHDPTVAEILPIGGELDKGTARLALPNALRTAGRGVLDMLHGPETGAMSADATNALLMGIGSPMAGMSSVARGTGGAIAGRLVGQGRNEVAPVLPEGFNPLATPSSRAAVNALSPSPPGAAMPMPGIPTNPLAVAPGVMLGADGIPTMRVTPGPADAGAAATAPGAIVKDTPRQALTNLEKSVTQSATERAGPGMQDHTVYVPGVERPLAAREFTPANALDDKVMRATDPVYRENVERIERRNNETMVDLLQSHAGDQISLGMAHDARELVAPPAQQLFVGESPVDASPLVTQIDRILRGPDGKRAAVARTLKDVRDSLFNADGEMETLPSQLYGARQNITDLLKKGAKGMGREADDARAAKSMLVGLLETVDPIIGSGAKKFQEYLKDFAAASEPINQMEFFQRYQTGPKKITGNDGVLQFNKVQKMLDDIYQGRVAKGINPAKSLTDEQIQAVVNVRNELAALQLRDRLAAVRGSDSFQQTNRAGVLGEGPLGVAVKGGAELGLHGLMATTPLSGIGNLALLGHRFILKPAMDASKAQKAANALAERKARLLDTTPNPLDR